MSCTPNNLCKIISCPTTDDLPSYLGSYNLQNGVTYENLLISVPAPGGGSYYVPPGTIVINLPPGATSVTYQGCQSTVSLPIPSGSTPAAIQNIVNQVMLQVAQQSAICNAPDDPHNPIPSPFPPVVFTNNEVFRSCPNGLLMNLIGTLPKNVFFSIDGLTLQAGVITSSISVADANNIGDNFLIGLIAGGALVQCGYWNTEQSFTCSDSSVQTTPADTIFSLVSQSDADALALAAAESACSSPYDCMGVPSHLADLVWAYSATDPGYGTASGAGATGSFSTFSNLVSPFNAFQDLTTDICNPLSVDIVVRFSFSVNWTMNLAHGGTAGIYTAGGFTPLWVEFTASGSATPDIDITVPAQSTLSFGFRFNVNSDTGTFDGTFSAAILP